MSTHTEGDCQICAWLLTLDDMQIGQVTACIADDMRRRWPGAFPDPYASLEPAVIAMAERHIAALPPEVAARFTRRRGTVQ